MKVLLVKMSSLGDLVHALPAVTEAAGQQARFHWVAEEAFAALPARHPGVERVLPIAWRRWRKHLWQSRRELRAFFQGLAEERYDLVMDAQGLLKSALVASCAHGKEKVGFSRATAREPAAAWFYDRRIEVPKGRHAIERQRQLFAGALGYPYREDQPLAFGPSPAAPPPRASQPQNPEDRRVPGAAPPAAPSSEASQARSPEDRRALAFGLPPPASGKDRCLFLHGASWPSKLWPEAMWVDLARRARDAGLQVALPWGNAAERGRAQRIAQAGGATALALPLAELMEELRQSRLVVGLDSGLTHLAAALGVPTLALHGSTSSALTGCRGSRARNLQAQFPCAPCLSRSCKYRGPAQHWQGATMAPACYAQLTPEIVWTAARELLDPGPDSAHAGGA